MARTKGDELLSRRAFVGKLAAGAAAAGAVATIGGRAEARTAGATDAATGTAPRAAAAVAETAAPLAEAPAPWELLRPLSAGAALAHGWTVAEVSPVRAGASVVTLRHAQGATRRVHLCRKGAVPAGLVHTERYDLVVMNGGAGDLPTEEGLAQAVAALAHAVAANEATQAEPVALLAHAERVERFAAGAKLR